VAPSQAPVRRLRITGTQCLSSRIIRARPRDSQRTLGGHSRRPQAQGQRAQRAFRSSPPEVKRQRTTFSFFHSFKTLRVEHIARLGLIFMPRVPHDNRQARDSAMRSAHSGQRTSEQRRSPAQKSGPARSALTRGSPMCAGAAQNEGFPAASSRRLSCCQSFTFRCQ
jgi:hypothetical protein